MRGLTKWPRLLVVGDDITEHQANEILVRTDMWMHGLYTPGRDWEAQVAKIATEFGRPAFAAYKDHVENKDSEGKSYWDREQEWKQKLGILELNYLHNDLISSHWIGGAHGWVNWQGEVGTRNYNIGKWPDAETVAEEWKAIAKAFPYLKLVAQLVPDEGEDPQAAVEYHIENGQVSTLEDPPTLLARPTDAFPSAFFQEGKGVTIERLREALLQVKMGSV